MKNKNTLISYVIILFVIIITIQSVSYIAKASSGNAVLNVANGNISLDNFDNSKTYSLTGSWEYYPGKLYTPADIIHSNSAKEFLHVKLIGNYVQGKYSTLALHITSKSDSKMVLKFSNFTGPFTIYDNGNIVDGDKNADYSFNGKYINHSINIAIDGAKNHDIVINLIRDNYFQLGLSKAPSISTELTQKVNDAYTSVLDSVISFIVLGATLIILIFYFIRRNEDKEGNAFMFLVLTGFTIYTRMIIEILTSNNYINITYFDYTKIIDIRFILTCYFAFMYTNFSESYYHRSKKYSNFISISTSIYIVYVVFSSTFESDIVYKITLIYFLFLLTFTFYTIIKSCEYYESSTLYTLTIITVLFISFAGEVVDFNLYFLQIFSFMGFMICFCIIFAKEMIRSNFTAIEYSFLDKNIQHEFDKKNKISLEQNQVLQDEIVARLEAEQKLIETSTKDYMTGLFNRLYANKFLVEFHDKYTQFGHPFSIVILDIDNFKYVNDTYGHGIGDETIKSISVVMQNTVRQNDVVVRWGGEEFLVILPNTGLSSGVYVAEKIRKSVEHTKIKEIGKVTISLGVAEIKAGLSFDEVIAIADENLLLAKRNGKNCTYPK